MVHKCLNGWTPNYLNEKFTRRFYEDLSLPRFRLKTGQRSFAFREAAQWNTLDKNLKDITDSRL